MDPVLVILICLVVAVCACLITGLLASEDNGRPILQERMKTGRSYTVVSVIELPSASKPLFLTLLQDEFEYYWLVKLSVLRDLNSQFTAVKRDGKVIFLP